MTELLTAAQMKAIEAAAIASGEVTGLELMERAGRGVVDAVFEEWPELAATSHRAAVLCGPGNNGGDGFVVARLLKEWGWEVEVFLYGTPERMPPDARVNYERWLGMGEVGDYWNFDATRTWRDLTVDALFGIGAFRPFEVAGQHEKILATSDRMVAVDVPTGLDADTGATAEPHFHADLTVTFHYPKLGHFLGRGPENCGRLRVVDIGLQGVVEGSVSLIKGPSTQWNTSLAKTSASTWSVGKVVSPHKYSHGHALILSGPPGHGGAARLSARGALRIGAGLVTVACPPDAVPENAARLDAVMLRAVADGAGLVEVLGDSRINALCLGPGLGLDSRAVGLVTVALGRVGNLPTSGAQDGEIAHPTRPIVLDADALTILSQHPDLFAALHANCILTPHNGEFARLFPDIAAKLNAPATKGPAYSKVDATREAAARAGCVVLFKGPDTVIASPDGRCSINSAHYDRAAPWLATAGSGDVLAGFITGLLARGFVPMQAAETAAWLHVECARSFGPGLIAEDLAEELPRVFRALGL